MRMKVVGAALLCAALAEVCLLACHRKSFDDYPSDGVDAGDGGSDFDGGIVLGDDSSAVGDGLVPDEGGNAEASGPPCTIPDGTYTVTATPLGDAGAGDAGACGPNTTTLVWPPNDLGPDGGCSGNCCYAPSGDLPFCAVDFSCSQDDGTYTTKLSGFIQVLNGSFAGQETEIVFFDRDAGVPVATCDYDLSYTMQ
jgi:hypothetical protein